MNVDELYQLSVWYTDQYRSMYSLYNDLLTPINHNSTQPDKRPVEDHLDSLTVYLNSMNFEELSLQQLKLLSDLGVDKLIGKEGARYVESLVRTSDFDPATATTKINEAIKKLAAANTGFVDYGDSLESLGMIRKHVHDEIDEITIRIGFQKDAMINNVVEWKDSAKDWYDIIRGLALACNEAPERTKIVGASSGSIILIMVGTLSVTTLLALISKNIASVAKDAIGIGNLVEDLRAKRLLTKVIEADLKKQEASMKEKSLAEIMNIIKARNPNIDGEQVNGLEVSIKKILSFNEKGGNIDFVAPEIQYEDEEEEGADLDGNEEALTALSEARIAIHEYQAVREQIKMLSDLTGEP